MTNILPYIDAAYSILAIKTHEPDRAQQALVAEVKKDNNRTCYSWDISGNMQNLTDHSTNQIQGPVAALGWLSNEAEENTILFAWNMHRFLTSIEVIQAIQNGRDVWKSHGKVLIILAPDITLPPEIEKSVTIIDYALPDKTALATVLRTTVSDAGCDYPKDAEAIIQSALGLTAFEAENALALALSDTGLKGFNKQIIAEQKAQIVKKNASLEISHFEERFSDIGGLDNLKEFCKKTIASDLARGVMLLGTPGTGKSMFSKALGNETGLPVLSLDFGKLFGSLVGSSEQKTRDALAVADAMAPCIMFIDEIEKGLSGIQSSGQTDGGTGSRVFGSFLTWLSDHKSKVYVIATANSTKNIPPEFLRAERWDAIFFVDLPTESERNVILDMYTKQYQTQGAPPSMEGWTGAEIKSLCRIAAMMKISLKEASRYVIPLSKSMGEKIKESREWAKGRCIPASQSNTTRSTSRKLSSKPKVGPRTPVSLN